MRQTDTSSEEVLLLGGNATPFSRFAYHGLHGEDEAAKTELADDVMWTLMPSGQVLRGKEQAYQFLGAAFRAVADRKPDLINNVAIKDWGVFEYWNIGTVDEELIEFARATWGTLPGDPGSIVGQTFRVPVCFVYHIDSQGKIDLVREYLDIASFVTHVSPGTT